MSMMPRKVGKGGSLSRDPSGLGGDMLPVASAWAGSAHADLSMELVGNSGISYGGY